MSGKNCLDDMGMDIFYDVRWSDEIDNKFEADFIEVCSEVFNTDNIKKEFKNKFLENIYGKSVLAIAYMGSKPCAARALWRNDINYHEAYQPSDTCVKSICRGKGIFTKITKLALSKLPAKSLIYNFPNHNSFPGYLKMGWKLYKECHMRLFLSYRQFNVENPIKIDVEYANWWLLNKNIYYKKIRGHYFLIRKDSRPFCYVILGETSKNVATKFKVANWGLYFYKSESRSWYNKKFKPSYVVSLGDETISIPTWKIDAI